MSNPLLDALGDAPGPEETKQAVEGDCEICDEQRRWDGSGPSPSALAHPWHVCQVCGNTMKAWPHRNNHYRNWHQDADPRVA